jgi:pyruvate formate lyase activating enzyme
MKVQCSICPHRCTLEEGQAGFCRARSNRGGEIADDNYGRVTAMALDPIEKKPLKRFFPGSHVLSVGSYGCNLRCSFCQNHEISMCGDSSHTVSVSPESIIDKAQALVSQGNIGIAFTYNEPLIGYEFVRDCAAIAHEQGLKTVLVTNGYINDAPLAALLPLVDAMNIDLKGFTEAYYRKLSGHIAPVLRAIEIASGCCHVEITTLIIPNENDSFEEMYALSAWLSGISPDIPLHVSRFFPRYHMTDRPATNIPHIYAMAETARKNLRYVYEGNC